MGGGVHIHFWGTRGSIAVPGKSTSRFGGNTSCLEIVSDGYQIICDAGSGIRQLGRRMSKSSSERRQESIPILLSHTHWDHICGFPFFAPIYENGQAFDIIGPAPQGKQLEGIIRTSMRSEYFPRPVSTLPSTITFRTVRKRSFHLGDVLVTPLPVCHPGGAVGWGFDFPGGERVVFVSDNELNVRTPYASAGLATGDRIWWRPLFEYVSQADVLIHDAQYTPTEYRSRVGWGHSTYTELLGFAIRSGVGRLVLFHHDPDRSDSQLIDVLAKCRKMIRRSGATLRCELAREGSKIIIP